MSLGLIPEPRSVLEFEGSLDLGAGGFVRGTGGLEGAAALAASWMNEALALRGSAARLRASASERAGAVPLLSFVADPSLPAEDYRLEIGPEGAVARASSREGAVHAASTLRQLVLSEGAVLPALRIEDGPRFAWRGAMLDCARNFFRPEFIERFIDLMALHKLNRFHWHLTDDQAWRLEIASHPEITKLGSRRRDLRYPSWVRYNEGSYSREDARRLVAYAAERGIVVVPEIETPGHVLALLASHPELSCRGAAAEGGAFAPDDRYGIFEDILCAGSDSVFDLLGEVYDEVASIFPGPWVHAGGDEALKGRWNSCPRCRSRMEAEGLGDAELLQGWFMDKVAAMLAARGKRMIGWDEILDGAREGAPASADVIVMSWRGAAGGIEAAREGYDAVMCPQTKACYLDHKHLDLAEEPGNIGVCTVEDSYGFDPVPAELSREEAAHILGGQGNIWTEFMYFGRQVEYMAFPRLCALSEVFWSPSETRDFASFERRMGKHGLRLDQLGVNRYRGPFRAIN